MKKIIGLVIVLTAVIFTACSSYTCPTYAKYAPDKQVKRSTGVPG